MGGWRSLSFPCVPCGPGLLWKLSVSPHLTICSHIGTHTPLLLTLCFFFLGPRPFWILLRWRLEIQLLVSAAHTALSITYLPFIQFCLVYLIYDQPLPHSPTHMFTFPPFPHFSLVLYLFSSSFPPSSPLIYSPPYFDGHNPTTIVSHQYPVHPQNLLL